MALYSSKENQDFFINTIKLSGLQSLGLRWNSEVEPSLEIQNPSPNYINSKIIEADLNLDYIPLEGDILLNFTGNQTFSGKFNYNNKYFIFKTGVLNNYNLNYQIDSLITAKASIKVFAEVFSETGLQTLRPQEFSINPYNFQYADIYLDSEVIDKTLINSFDLVIDCPKNPNYKVGQYVPDDFMPSLPLRITFNLNTEINDYNYSGISNLYNKPKVNTLDLKLKKYSNGQNSYNFNFNNLTKLEENSDFSTINNGRINFTYYTVY